MINQDIIVSINGEPFACSSSAKLIDVLAYLDFDTELVTIEYNSKIISKSSLSNVLLKNQDIIEIVTIVGGG